MNNTSCKSINQLTITLQEDDGRDRIHASDRATIKTIIVSLMPKSPEAIRRQFSDAVALIAKHDFPEKWPNLITELRTQMIEQYAIGM